MARNALEWLRSVDWGDALRDAHCYGGIALAGAGAGAAVAALTGARLAGIGVGLLIVGVALFWLSVRKVASGGPTPNP